jgi:hypothetical protein
LERASNGGADSSKSQAANIGIAESMIVGFFTAIGVTTLGITAPKAIPIVDLIMKPGDVAVTFLFGGLHGLEPLLFAIAIDALLFGCVFQVVVWGATRMQRLARPRKTAS